jgi:predicted Zn-dependent protease
MNSYKSEFKRKSVVYQRLARVYERMGNYQSAHDTITEFLSRHYWLRENDVENFITQKKHLERTYKKFLRK